MMVKNDIERLPYYQRNWKSLREKTKDFGYFQDSDQLIAIAPVLHTQGYKQMAF